MLVSTFVFSVTLTAAELRSEEDSRNPEPFHIPKTERDCGL